MDILSQIVFLVLVSGWCLAESHRYVGLYPIKRKCEAIYRYVSKTERLIDQMHARDSIEYDVVWRKGRKADELLVKLSNAILVGYDDNIIKTSPELYLPFILHLNEVGRLHKVDFAPQESTFSTDEKLRLLKLMFFNKSETFKSPQGSRDPVVNEQETIFGDCSQVVKVQNFPAKDTVKKLAVIETLCPNSSYVKTTWGKVQPEMDVKEKPGLTRKLLSFVKIEESSVFSKDTSKRMRRESFQSFQFVKYRPPKTRYHVNMLTETRLF